MSKISHIMTEDQRRAEYLGQMSDQQLQCRAGHRHRFPSDELNPRARTVPDGMTVRLVQGMYEIEEDCMRDCGRVRTYATRSGGLFDADTRYNYFTRPARKADWVTIPQDSGVTVTGRDCKGELFERALPLLRKAARAQQRDDRAAEIKAQVLRDAQ